MWIRTVHTVLKIRVDHEYIWQLYENYCLVLCFFVVPSAWFALVTCVQQVPHATATSSIQLFCVRIWVHEAAVLGLQQCCDLLLGGVLPPAPFLISLSGLVRVCGGVVGFGLSVVRCMVFRLFFFLIKFYWTNSLQRIRTLVMPLVFLALALVVVVVVCFSLLGCLCVFVLEC